MDLREYMAVHGCARALMTAVVVVAVAVGDTSGPSSSKTGSLARADTYPGASPALDLLELARGDRAHHHEKQEHPDNAVQTFPGIAAGRQKSKYRQAPMPTTMPFSSTRRSSRSAGGAVWRPVMARHAGLTSAWIASHAKARGEPYAIPACLALRESL